MNTLTQCVVILPVQDTAIPVLIYCNPNSVQIRNVDSRQALQRVQAKIHDLRETR